MAGMSFVRNSDGFAQAAVGSEVAEAVKAIAEKGVGIARGLAVDFVQSGEYESAFETSTEIVRLPGDRGGTPHDAVVGIIKNTSDHNLDVEYGGGGARGPERAEKIPGGRADTPKPGAHRIFGRMLAQLAE